MSVRQKKLELIEAMNRARAMEPSSFVPNKLLDTLTAAIDHVANQNAVIGLSAGRLERIGEGLAARGIEIADERKSVEDTDLESAIALLNAQDLTLSAAQAAFAKINRQTMFDLLN